MKTIIADLTNAYSGKEAYLLECLENAYPQDLENVVVLCKAYQRPFAGPQFPHVRAVNALHSGHIVALVKREYLETFVSSGSDRNDKLIVVTLDPAVLDLRMGISENERQRVDFIRWAQLLPQRNFSQPGKEVAQNALASLMSESEVLGAAERALTRARAIDRASAIRMSDIRMHIEVEEPRFKKTHPGANISGVIGAAMELCEKRGLILADRTMDRINYFLWLQPSRKVPVEGNGHRVEPSDEKLSDSPLEHEANSGESRVTGPIVSWDANLSRKESDSTIISGERQSRSDQFVNSLRKQGLGPFSRFRRLLYDALEDAAKGGDKSLVLILSLAVESTKARVATDPEGKPIPWRKVREFLRNMVARRAVLLCADGPISQSFQSLSTPVVAVAANWRLELDGELIVALVRDGMNVHLADLPFIAGALFNDRSGQAEAQAVEVIEFLLKIHRLKEDAEHYLREPDKVESNARMLSA